MQWACWAREQHEQSSRSKREGGSGQSAFQRYSDGQGEGSSVLLNSLLCAHYEVSRMDRKKIIRDCLRMLKGLLP